MDEGLNYVVPRTVGAFWFGREGWPNGLVQGALEHRTTARPL